MQGWKHTYLKALQHAVHILLWQETERDPVPHSYSGKLQEWTLFGDHGLRNLYCDARRLYPAELKGRTTQDCRRNRWLP